MPDDVPGAVVKVVELVGSSDHSFSDAVRNAVKTASATIRGIRGVDVIHTSAEVDDNGEIRTYKVDCKIAFVVEGTEQPTPGRTGTARMQETPQMRERARPHIETATEEEATDVATEQARDIGRGERRP